MAIRQYIGARYIPKFMGTYDATQQYDALDVVDNGSGTSYIARKTVPAGTPLTDTEFWFVYGAASGAIVALQNDMINAQNDILGLQSDVSDAQADIGAVNNIVSNQHRRIVTIADSYGEHPTVADSWQGKMSVMMDGIDYIYNMHQNGIGYYRQSGGYNAVSLFNANLGNITDPDTITDVVVCLGMNDAGQNLSDVRQAVNDLIDAVELNMPNATLWAGYPQCGIHMTDALLTDCINVVYAIEGVIGRHSKCRWMSGLEYIMHDTANQEADEAHPNAAGSIEIVRGIATCMNGGVYKYSLSTTNTMYWRDGDTATCRVIIDGPITRIYVGGITKSATVALTASNWVDVGTLGSCRIKNRSTCTIPVFIRDADSSTIYPAQAKTDGTTLYFMLRQGTANIRFAVYDMTFVMPTFES